MRRGERQRLDVRRVGRGVKVEAVAVRVRVSVPAALPPLVVGAFDVVEREIPGREPSDVESGVRDGGRVLRGVQLHHESDRLPRIRFQPGRGHERVGVQATAEQLEGLPVGRSDRAVQRVAHSGGEESTVVGGEPARQLVQPDVALDGAPLAHRGHPLVDRIVVVTLEDRDRVRGGRPEAVRELLAPRLELADAIDDLVDGQLVGDAARLLPLEVAVVALVANRSPPAIGAGDAQVDEPVQVLLRRVPRAVRDLGHVGGGCRLGTPEQGVVHPVERVDAVPPVLPDRLDAVGFRYWIELGHKCRYGFRIYMRGGKRICVAVGRIGRFGVTG